MINLISILNKIKEDHKRKKSLKNTRYYEKRWENKIRGIANR